MTHSEEVAESAPTVTVVVPVYEDLARLKMCLALIAAQDYPAELINVIVVDNASRTDLTPALPPGDPRFTLIREMQRGSYAARNAGLKIAEGEMLAFTDADCLPHPTWISTAVAILTEEGHPQAVGGDIHLVFRNGMHPRSGPELYESAHEFPQRRFVEVDGFAATANLVVSRSVMSRVGPFNAALKSGGDQEWGKRLHASGARMVFSARAVVDHPARSSWFGLAKKTVRVERGISALTVGQQSSEDRRYIGQQLRIGLGIWRAVWRQDWPASRGEKAKYAAAQSWVNAFRIAERIRARSSQRIRSRGLSRSITP
ncbi:glycosyltransferase [Microbacterium sp. NPDC055910]|uniref:glycosyltransferase n=1 Tax=Microbacterium sp. NPDC055910 TaxID=3345659 RepID=UPI0035D6BD27